MHTTNAGGTATVEGVIPHRMHPMGFRMPVSVLTTKRKFLDRNGEAWEGNVVITKDSLCYPARNAEGRLIYALPGGDRYIP